MRSLVIRRIFELDGYDYDNIQGGADLELFNFLHNRTDEELIEDLEQASAQACN